VSAPPQPSPEEQKSLGILDDLRAELELQAEKLAARIQDEESTL